MSTCRLCRGNNVFEILDLGDLPIAHRMPRTKEECEDLFNFTLSGCADCGFVQSAEPIDPKTLYSGFNFNFSHWKLEPHIDDELDTIFSHVQPRRVCEIGCNDGRFLDLLSGRGVEKCFGIEPNAVPVALAREKGYMVANTMVAPDVARDLVRQNGGAFDLVVCRQALEHIPDIENYFDSLEILVETSGHLFIDVPDFGPALDQGDISVLWEEHVSYYTRETLVNLLEHRGFAPKSVTTYDFSGGAVAVLATRCGEGAPLKKGSPHLIGAAKSYGGKVRAYQEQLRRCLSELSQKDYAIVLYGVGCRSTTLMNGTNLAPYVDFAVDDQEEKQRFFIPGAKLSIRPYEALKDVEVKIVCLLGVNNESETKVEDRLRKDFGSRVIPVSVFGPHPLQEGLDVLARL